MRKGEEMRWQEKNNWCCWLIWRQRTSKATMCSIICIQFHFLSMTYCMDVLVVKNRDTLCPVVQVSDHHVTERQALLGNASNHMIVEVHQNGTQLKYNVHWVSHYKPHQRWHKKVYVLTTNLNKAAVRSCSWIRYFFQFVLNVNVCEFMSLFGVF